MNAGCENRVVCAYPGPCCQPGTVHVLCGQGAQRIPLEFCTRHALEARVRWGGRR